MTREAQNNNWPLPKFYFVVDWGNFTNIPFQEISGLDNDTQSIEYRNGNNTVFSEVSMPGIIKNNNVTLKKGVFIKDNIFWDWYAKIKMHTAGRQNVVIKLLDEKGIPTMTWTLINAWVSKINTTNLKSNGNEVAVDIMEMAHEGLTIVNS